MIIAVLIDTALKYCVVWRLPAVQIFVIFVPVLQQADKRTTRCVVAAVWILCSARKPKLRRTRLTRGGTTKGQKSYYMSYY